MHRAGVEHLCSIARARRIVELRRKRQASFQLGYGTAYQRPL